MESAAGLTALALFVLWLGYWVPHRIRQRQELAEARVDDRFSDGLRVLTVAGGARGTDPGDLPEIGARPSLLLPAAPAPGTDLVLRRSDDVPELPAQATDRRRPRQGSGTEEGTHAMDSTGTTTARAAAPARPQDARPAGPTRLAVLEQRAARARRRLTLTLLLLLATAGTWVVVGLGAVPWPVGLVPTALLALVLVLGRLAVLAAQRADREWAAQRRAERPATGAVRVRAGSSARAASSRARVTGHAVHASGASTQMIPRVSATDARSRAAAAPTPASAATAGSARGSAARSSSDDAERPAAEEPVRVDAPVVGEAGASRGAAGAGEAVEAVGGARGAEAPQVRPEPVPAGEALEADVVVTPPGATPWEPVPVPLPTYVTKPAAPRREPAPLPAAEASGGSASAAAGLGARAPQASAPVVRDDVVEDAPRAAGDDPRPSTETLGLPLDEILARRRAAG